MSEFNLEEIYEDNIPNDVIISIEHVASKQDAPLCVLGVLNTNRGNMIKKELLEWLTPEYDVYCVYQNSPGVLYEYPAIRFAQYLLNKTESNYCLYLHTKGAANSNTMQIKVRNYWKQEFSGENKTKYIDVVKNNDSVVSCPFEGENGNTWFNGFFVTRTAINKLGTIQPNKDRYYFERMFKDFKEVKVNGLLLQGVSSFQVSAHVHLTMKGVRVPTTPYRFNQNVVKSSRRKIKRRICMY